MADSPSGEIRAAGAVLWRRGPQQVEVALVHRPRYDDWSFPKGKRDVGEHLLLTAVREVAEEAGVRVALGRRLPTTRYLSDGKSKRVDYWAASALSPDGFTPGDEVDDLAWLPVTAARGQLSYPHDVTVLDGFASAPPDTTPVILLRHADAVGRTAWRVAGHNDELARPLSSRGQLQADALGQILGCFSPALPVSSCAERCLATLRPYAARTATVIETEPGFTVDGSGSWPDEVTWTPSEEGRQRMAALAAGGAPVIVCGHRQNMPWLLDVTCESLGSPAMTQPPLRKGAFWVLQVHADRVISAEHHQAEPDD
jgi:8-oxo-(d)GTP phosphatase